MSGILAEDDKQRRGGEMGERSFVGKKKEKIKSRLYDFRR